MAPRRAAAEVPARVSAAPRRLDQRMRQPELTTGRLAVLAAERRSTISSCHAAPTTTASILQHPDRGSRPAGHCSGDLPPETAHRGPPARDAFLVTSPVVTLASRIPHRDGSTAPTPPTARRLLRSSCCCAWATPGPASLSPSIRPCCDAAASQSAVELVERESVHAPSSARGRERTGPGSGRW